MYYILNIGYLHLGGLVIVGDIYDGCDSYYIKGLASCYYWMLCHAVYAALRHLPPLTPASASRMLKSLTTFDINAPHNTTPPHY